MTADYSYKKEKQAKHCVHTYRKGIAGINPAIPPVRTYMAKHRKNRLY